MALSMAPWCKRCPMGHSSLHARHTKDHYLCDACATYYAGEPVDAREVTSFPMPSSEYEVVGKRGSMEVSNNA